METLVQRTIDSLSLGSLYAILALGVALVFGIMGFINFAHGQIIMVSGYVLFLMERQPFFISLTVALGAAMLLAFIIERSAFKPIRKANPATQLVTSFAIAFLLENLVTLTLGSRAKSVALPIIMTEQFNIGEIRLGKLDLFTMLATVAIITLLALFLKRSKLGIQMRAAAEDFQTARLLGVRADTVIATAFILSGLLAGVAMIILLGQTGQLTPDMGLRPVVIGFVATILGGLGSLWGAALGGFILGFLTIWLQSTLPIEVVPFRDAFMFSIVILIFLFRPQGLIVVRTAGKRV